MKRDEFLKRIGFGIFAAAVAPSLLKGKENELPEGWYDYGDNTINDGADSLAFWRQSNNLNIEVTDLNDVPINLENSTIYMQIKGNDKDIYLKEFNGLEINYNTIGINCELAHGEYDYELLMDRNILSKGKLRI